MSFVQVQGLSRRFDLSEPWLARLLSGKQRRLLTAVDNVSFSIERGSTYALVGESGSGKSTIARMVVGLLPPSAGSVSIDGVNLADPKLSAQDKRQLRHRLQMVFQSPYASLNPRWRVRDILLEPIKVFQLVEGKAAQMARVGQLLDQVGLSAHDGAKYPHEFSGGQRQRISIARALASNPDVIICDEPTSALDVSVQAQVSKPAENIAARISTHLPLHLARPRRRLHHRQPSRRPQPGSTHRRAKRPPALHQPPSRLHPQTPHLRPQSLLSPGTAGRLARRVSPTRCWQYR